MAPLDESHAAFIQSAVSISAAARAADGMPALARSHGCSLNRSGRVRLLFARPKSQELLAAVAATRVIAVAFNEPTTHRSIQLKGRDAAIVPSDAADEGLASRYRDLMAGELLGMGYSGQWVGTLLFVAPGDLVAVEFTPARAFAQTPGPRAGAPLEMR